MKNVYLFLSIFFLIGNISAQNYRFQAGGGVGLSNYLGDIGGKYVPRRDYFGDLRLTYTSITANLHGKYALTPRLNLGLQLNYGRIAAEDSTVLNPARRDRNLHFRNNIFEVATTIDLDIYEAYNVGKNNVFRVDYTLYLTGGLAYYKHNPQALFDGQLRNRNTGQVYNYSGWHDLQPLKTEGQTTPYPLSGLAKIVGLGMDFTLESNYRMGFQVSVRFVSTDYLDDVSGSYNMRNFADDSLGTLAYHLADKSRYPVEDFDKTGFSRGNPNHKDSYVFSTLYFAYVFKGKGGTYKRKFHNGYIRKKGRRLNVNRFFDW